MDAERNVDSYLKLGLSKLLNLEKVDAEIHEGIVALVINIKFPCKTLCEKIAPNDLTRELK